MKELNSNANYLSWKTEVLVYEGQNLETVFDDLYRVHNINVEVDNKSILESTLNTTFDNQSADTIIRIICTTFNLNFSKEGDVYLLTGNSE